MFLRIVLNGLFAASALLNRAPVEGAQEPPAKRLSSIVGVAVEEYAKGIDANGRLISATELEEAAGFLRDAKEVAQRLTSPNADVVRLLLDSLVASADRHAKPGQLAALDKKLRTALGTDGALDLPARAPDLARGRTLYAQHCVQCHGPTGAGDGPQAKTTTTPPPPIGTAAFMHGVTPAFAYRVVAVGIPNTNMISWAPALSADDRWAVIQYVTSLRADDAARARGAVLLKSRCATCGSTGQPAAADFLWLAERSDDDIAAAIGAGDPATGIRDGASLASDDVHAIVAALRANPVVGQAQIGRAHV